MDLPRKGNRIVRFLWVDWGGWRWKWEDPMWSGRRERVEEKNVGRDRSN